MNAKKFSEALGNVRDEYVSEAIAYQSKRKNRSWIKWGAMAACLCLAVLAIRLFWNTSETTQDGINSGNDTFAGPAHFVVDNRTFIISSYLSVADELPDGFTLAGNINISGGFEDCPYYLNPDVPEWIYVYHEVRTDGTVDSTGTLTSTPPHNAYVRYVDERLRGKDLVCCNGNCYISMWSAQYLGDNPDVTREYYDEMDSLYGNRIEGVPPDGFVLAGTAEFTGYDTVPTGTLASNTGITEVYYNSSDPTVIFVGTHWFTATAAENGETRHDGFNVYILYDCPFWTETETIEFHD